jgi:ABC-2 type transport system permease protein
VTAATARADAARGVAATFRSAVAEATANRTALWSHAGAMALNDLAWVAFWLLFIDRVGDIGGWDADRILLLNAVFTTVGGIVLGLFANTHRLGRLAVDGELDAVLALPVPPLAHLLARRVEAINLGDAAFGIGLFVVVGDPTPARVGLFALAVLAGSAVLTGFLVLTQSVALFIGRGDVGDLATHSVLVLTMYPAEVFAGAPRALLYTVVPAAFIGTVPVTLVEDIDVAKVAALVAAAVTFTVAGWAAFTLGLRRYTSGSAWVR